MFSRMSSASPVRLRLLGLALLVVALLMLGTRSGRAADTVSKADDESPGTKTDVLKDSSLGRVPQDASFFMSSLRNKEQLDRFFKSNAYKTLKQLPAFKLAYKAVLDKLSDEGGPLEHLEAFKKDKDNAELLEILTASLNDEVFIYGGKGWTDLFNLYRKVSAAINNNLDTFGAGDPQALIRVIVLELQKNLDTIRVPELVIGLKTSHAKKFEAQIKRLEKVIAKAVDKQEKLKGKFKREGNFLTLQVDGGMLPWDDFETTIRDAEENKGDFDKLINHVKKATLSFSVGVKGDYLLIALGSSVKDLESFGGDKGKFLASRPELKPLTDHAKKKISFVSYTSKDYLNAIFQVDWDAQAKGYKRLIDMTAKKEEGKQDPAKNIKADIDSFAAMLKKWMPGYGARVSFSWMTPQGYESLNYDHGNHDHLKGVNTTLLDHVGGDPIFAAAFGFKVDGTNYATLSKHTQAIYGHVEKIFLEHDQIPDEAKDVYRRVAGVLLPTAKKFDDNVKKNLIPSMKGQSGLGIVVDARWKSKKWIEGMPSVKRDLAMFEPGLLIGISDADKFTTAMTDFRKTFLEAYKKAGEAAGVDLPELKLEPKKVKGKNGTLYTWQLPKESGLDQQVEVTAGVSKNVAVLAMSRKHAETLLAKTKLGNTKDGPLAMKRDLVGGMVFNFGPLVDAAMDWVESAPEFVVGDDEGTKFIRGQVENAAKQAKAFKPILKCFRGFQSASYLEGSKLVTHTRIEFKDLDESPEPNSKD